MEKTTHEQLTHFLMELFDQFPHFNSNTLAMLRKSSASNPEVLNELFKSFIEDSSELIMQIKSAISDQDYNRFSSTVHTLKGLCGTIGATRLYEVLKIMDSCNKNDDFAESNKYLKQFELIHFDTIHLIQTDLMKYSS